MEQTNRRFQLRCKCGKVKQILGHGELVEADKKCDICGQIITENNIVEIKQEFLLE